MYEVDGNHNLTRALVDSLSYGWQPNNAAASGDIDGDGIDECIWTTPDSIRVYKASGDNDLREVWCWANDHGNHALMNTVYDVNSDGYNELIAASNAKISIFEVDAVDLLAPNGGSCSVGDTVPIRWVVNTPPRCDSLSLFLRRDSLWHFTTIATGLPTADTLYHWVVPAGVPETARVVVIAYGPGWQFDMSDSVITFIGGGVVEESRRVFVTRLRGCAPNPFGRATAINYQLGTAGLVALTLHDVTGRAMRRLASGPQPAGFHSAVWDGKDDKGRVLPAGVYFCRMQTGSTTQSKRVTLIR
jgi:hypothetical protein